MKDSDCCKECGTPLDEIPLVECKTHRRYLAQQADMTNEEFEDMIDFDALELEVRHDG